jgi:hypothetical protein
MPIRWVLLPRTFLLSQLNKLRVAKINSDCREADSARTGTRAADSVAYEVDNTRFRQSLGRMNHAAAQLRRSFWFAMRHGPGSR